jgi:2-C-methyl-D-erythritol 4-phosphate cytidylyltransferase
VAPAPVWSIVVAGGSGRRFGQLKQFSPLGGRPVLEWAVQACRVHSAGVVLVLPSVDVRPGGPQHGADIVVAGGESRAASVGRGLAAVPEGAEVVLVHDAARPLTTPATFEAVLGALAEDGVDGVVPGVPVHDTIKQVDTFQTVTATLDRATLVAVQTPQGFRAAALRLAHAAHGAHGPDGATDDAMLVEATGGRVRVVPGDPGNLKITTPDDLALAERLLSGPPDGR